VRLVIQPRSGAPTTVPAGGATTSASPKQEPFAPALKASERPNSVK
jgi:hypothetical protein